MQTRHRTSPLPSWERVDASDNEQTGEGCKIPAHNEPNQK